MVDEKPVTHKPCKGTRRLIVRIKQGCVLKVCTCAGKDTMVGGVKK